MESGQCMEGVPDATITHELCLQSHEQITKQIKALVDDTGVQHVFVGSDVDPRLSYIRKKLGPAVSHHLITCTLLTLGAQRSEGYSTWSVSPSVCLSGTPYSATTRNKAAKKRYQRVQYHTVLIFKIAIFVKVLRSRVMA